MKYGKIIYVHLVFPLSIAEYHVDMELENKIIIFEHFEEIEIAFNIVAEKGGIYTHL